jgi:hypothetical protein
MEEALKEAFPKLIWRIFHVMIMLQKKIEVTLWNVQFAWRILQLVISVDYCLFVSIVFMLNVLINGF